MILDDLILAGIRLLKKLGLEAQYRSDRSRRRFLQSDCRIFKKETGHVDGEQSVQCPGTNPAKRQISFRSFSSKNLDN